VTKNNQIESLRIMKNQMELFNRRIKFRASQETGRNEREYSGLARVFVEPAQRLSLGNYNRNRRYLQGPHAISRRRRAGPAAWQLNRKHRFYIAIVEGNGGIGQGPRRPTPQKPERKPEKIGLSETRDCWERGFCIGLFDI
jgi:hypothetical protein